MQNKFIRNISNFLTLGNLFLGCLGIVYCFSDHIAPVELRNENIYGTQISVIFGYDSRLFYSSFMIFGAAILDFFDGFVARWLKAESPMGKQLDSLADVVTFGVLPGCIFFQLLSASFYMKPDALYVQLIYMVPALLIPVCAAWRLAKFNIDEGQKNEFRGLAVPAMAIFVAALPLIIFTNTLNFSLLILNQWFLYSSILVLSWLMISNIPMFSFKLKSKSIAENILPLSFALACIVLILVFKYAGIAASILFYIIVCIIRNTLKKKDIEVEG